MAKKQALQLFEEKKVRTVWDDEQLFRLIQSLPSPKAEPSKQWMAELKRSACGGDSGAPKGRHH